MLLAGVRLLFHVRITNIVVPSAGCCVTKEGWGWGAWSGHRGSRKKATCNHARDQQRRECLNPSGWSPRNIVVTLGTGKVLVYTIYRRIPKGSTGCVNVVGWQGHCMQFFRELANTFVQNRATLDLGSSGFERQGLRWDQRVGWKARAVCKCISQWGCEPGCDCLRGQQHNIIRMSNWLVSF